VEVEAILRGETSVAATASKRLPPVATATPAAAPPLPVEPIASPRAERGYAVQLGAFASNANARNFLEHVQNQVATTGVEAKIRQADGLFKVYVGPFGERDEAQRIALQLETAFGFTTTLAPH
jgi:cell division septation protein DedD